MFYIFVKFFKKSCIIISVLYFLLIFFKKCSQKVLLEKKPFILGSGRCFLNQNIKMLIKHNTRLSSISIVFDDEKIKKNIFYRSRRPFSIGDIAVNKIIISKEVVYGSKHYLKYFIGYNDEEDVIRPLLLKLPQMIGYLKEFDDNTTMSLRADDSKLFKKYCKI